MQITASLGTGFVFELLTLKVDVERGYLHTPTIFTGKVSSPCPSHFCKFSRVFYESKDLPSGLQPLYFTDWRPFSLSETFKSRIILFRALSTRIWIPLSYLNSWQKRGPLSAPGAYAGDVINEPPLSCSRCSNQHAAWRNTQVATPYGQLLDISSCFTRPCALF